MNVSGLTLRSQKGSPLDHGEVDGNFLALKQAIEAVALPFENGTKRPVVFSQSQPTDTGVIWAQLSTANTVVAVWWHNGTSWVVFLERTHWNATDSSTIANTVALSIPGATLVAGQKVNWQNLIAITGAANAIVNGGSPIPIRGCDGANLISGQVPAGWRVDALYDGTSLLVLNPNPAIGSKVTRWVSGVLPLTTETYNHTLGRAPDAWFIRLICDIEHGGYSVGDVIDGAILYIADNSDGDSYQFFHVVWGTSTFRFNAAPVGGGDAVMSRIKNQTSADGDRVALVDRNLWRAQVIAVIYE